MCGIVWRPEPLCWRCPPCKSVWGGIRAWSLLGRGACGRAFGERALVSLYNDFGGGRLKERWLVEEGLHAED